MAATTESLEERIERIKKQAKEIEKKHREVEEDRLMALKMNALVSNSTFNDESWPKTHKFDTLDFTFDIDQNRLNSQTQDEKEKVKEEEEDILIKKRIFKQFPEGEGPPPDPKYNFLADSQRDISFLTKKDNSCQGSNLGSFYKKNTLNLQQNQKKLYEASISKPDNQKFAFNSDEISKKCEMNEKNNSDNMIEKRGNITVSFSRSGEVKSVKLCSSPAIGTGRVGQKQFSKHHPGGQTKSQTKNEIRNQQFEKGASNKKVKNSAGHIEKETQSIQKNQLISRGKFESRDLDASNRNGEFEIIKTKLSENFKQIPRNKERTGVNQCKNNNRNSSFLMTDSSKLLNKLDNNLEVSNEINSSDTNHLKTPIKELSNKPEFAKKSVQDRLLKIRENSNIEKS